MSSATIGTLAIKLSALTGEFNRDMDQAGKKLSLVSSGAGATAKKSAEAFQKMSGAINLFQGSLGTMGGQLTAAMGKLSGIGGLLLGGPVGLGVAALSAGVAAAAAAWKVFTAETRSAEGAMKSMDESLLRMREGVQAHKDALAKLTEDVRFFGMGADDVQATKNQDRIAIIDKEIEANGRLINELIKRRHSVRGLGEEDEHQLQTLFRQNDAMRDLRKTLVASNEQLEERALKEFIGSEATLASAKSSERKAKALKKEQKETKDLLDDLQRLIDLDKKRRDEISKITGGKTLAGPAGVTGRGVSVKASSRVDLEARSVDEIMEHLRESGRTMVDKIADGAATFGAMFGNAMLSASGDLGQVVNSAMQGFQQGGPLGAIAAVFAELLSRSEGFQDTMAHANEAIAELVDAFEPLAEAMKPLAGLIHTLISIIADQLGPLFEAIGPIFEGLFYVVRGIMIGILNVVMAIGAAWNFIIQKIEDLVNFFKPGDDVDFSDAMINLNGINRAIARLHETTEDSTRADIAAAAARRDANNEVERTGAAFHELNSQLLNGPAGFKIDLRRYQASAGETMTPGFGGQEGRGATFVFQVHDAEELWRRLNEIDSFKSLAEGTQYPRRTPFSVSREGG